MATKLFEVQQKIFSALEASIDLKNAAVKTFDFVPEDTLTPYITFGQMHSTSENTKTENGEQINIFLEIWSEKNGRKEAVQIITFIEKALEIELVLDTASVISQKVLNRDVVEESYGLYHGTLEFQIILDWEE